MAGNDVFLYQVPSDTDADDVRLRDPALAANAGVSASLAVTEAADTLSSSAQVKLQGTESSTEQADTLVSAAALKLQGAVAATESANSLTASAQVKLQATLASTEQPDTLSATAMLRLQGSEAALENADTLASAAALKIQGSLGVSEQADTLASNATTGAAVETPSGASPWQYPRSRMAPVKPVLPQIAGNLFAIERPDGLISKAEFGFNAAEMDNDLLLMAA